jgi:hypothetical protein
MDAEILHSGFDGLKFTIQTDIPPALRERLAQAKAEATSTNSESIIDFGGNALSVRRTGGSAFSAHTGEYGAEWYFVDPENRSANNLGITVDFRTFLLATGGLQAAEQHFRDCMTSFGIPYVETQLICLPHGFSQIVKRLWCRPARALSNIQASMKRKHMRREQASPGFALVPSQTVSF